MAILDNPQEDLNVSEVSFMPTAQKWGLYSAAASIIFNILMSLVGFNFSNMMAFAMYGLLIFCRYDRLNDNFWRVEHPRTPHELRRFY